MRPGGQPNMQQLMKQAQKMQQQLAAAQAELAETLVEGQAGGLVRAVVLGNGELQSVTISPTVVDPEDIETLQDLVVAAVRDANRNAQALAEEKIGPLTAGMGGMGLGF